MKIVHFSTVHAAFDVRIFQRQCRTLARAGHDVTFIVTHDRDEVVEGVQIRALTKPRNRRQRMTQAVWTVFRKALAEKADLYHFHDPELIPVGVLLRCCGKRVIYDAHEDVPKDILMKTYLSMGVRRVLSPLAYVVEKIGALFFSGVVTATPSIARHFPPRKTTVVQNFPRNGELDVPDPLPYDSRPPLVVYPGGLSAERGTLEMIEAVGVVARSMEARLELAGPFQPASFLEAAKKLPAWQQVTYLGTQPRPVVAQMLSRARIGLVVYHPGPNHDDAQPNKLFEYMAAGIPLVASHFPLWRSIVESTGCGLLACPTNPQEIADAIRWLLEHPEEARLMGERGREAVRTRFNWEAEGDKLLRLYARLVPSAGPRIAAEEKSGLLVPAGRNGD
jgi:glycosyltransferase involved in cell wall biosynthesis